ncbi:MAG TPA: hypothetical protein VLT62_12010 [Candidatus Methylomirabilis sp.]|nr:hypothetical protein [Candidatus Methylomirabilis sp.]
MPTIIEYTQRKQPENRHPTRMVSPTSVSACGHAGLEPVGVPQRDGCWVFQYHCCRACGFTVRAVRRHVRDEDELAELQRRLAECQLSGASE